MSGFGKSVTGNIRKINEDSILVENNKIGAFPNLFVVADGMGGHLAGEVASSMAIEIMRNYFFENIEEKSAIETLEAAVLAANNEIYISGSCIREHFQMGTTLVAAIIANNTAHIINVGDSRLYVLNLDKNTINQITVDHSYIMGLLMKGKLTPEDAKKHPKRNELTRALGVDSKVKCDKFSLTIEDEDILLLCSDGLTNMLTDEEILNICKNGKNLRQMVDTLIDAANEKGGLDNISVILYCENDGV